MIANPIQFAVVREDPEIECQLLRELDPNAHAMLVGSGGCTAFTLRARFPSIELTLLEPNPNQIELIQKKAKALGELTGQARAVAFGIGGDGPETLTNCGNFESLFRSLRLFIYEFVSDRAGWLELFTQNQTEARLDQIFGSKYWPVAFQLFFSDSLLVAMFGPPAIQHAVPGSYPRYFQQVFERGLRAKNARDNYFLHHVFLGHYLDRAASLPAYLREPAPKSPPKMNFKNVMAQDMDSFASFDLLSFSNIFDWMGATDVKQIAEKVASEANVGTRLVYRQLNNDTNFRSLFGGNFKFDDHLARRLHASDRSLFYSSLHIAERV